MASILVVDSDPPRRRSIARSLRGEGFEVAETTPEDAAREIGAGSYRCVVVSDHRQIEHDASLRAIRLASESAPVLIVGPDTSNVIALVTAVLGGR